MESSTENKLNKRRVGAVHEQMAVEYLEKQGVSILEMNYSLKGGEIDIIAKDEDTYVFVEVKYRKKATYGYPAEAVTFSKQRTICRIATLYKQIKKLPNDGSFRFDVISILDHDITWYKNAFSYHV